MKKIIISLAASLLLSPLASQAACPELRFLNAYDLTAEDVSIMLSVRPDAMRGVTNLTTKGSKTCPAMTNPSLSQEAGWDMSVRSTRCDQEAQKNQAI